MKFRLSLVLVTLAAIVCGGAAFKCHSEEFYLAKRKLQQLKLEPGQQKAIDVYAKEFNQKWQSTHRKHGCSHHEAHASEFVVAASGVLSDDQFRVFRGRNRNGMERTGYHIRNTGEYLENLRKLVAAL